MKKKLLGIFIVCMLIFSLVGCSEETTLYVNVEENGNLNNNTLGERSLIELGKGLVYDSATKIVYMEIGEETGYKSKTYCPYYAPNGLPFRYNTETNTLIEIKNNN